MGADFPLIPHESAVFSRACKPTALGIVPYQVTAKASAHQTSWYVPWFVAPQGRLGGDGRVKSPALSTSILLDAQVNRRPMTVRRVSGSCRQFLCETASRLGVATATPMLQGLALRAYNPDLKHDPAESTVEDASMRRSSRVLPRQLSRVALWLAALLRQTLGP
jgi:hypothetical protein